MSATETGSETTARVSNDNFASESFVNDPPPQDGLLPNGEPKRALEHRPHRGRRAVAPWMRTSLLLFTAPVLHCADSASRPHRPNV